MELLRKAYLFLIDALQSLLIAALFFLLIYVFIAKPFNVVGLSMYPNFQDKSYVLTNKIGLHFSDPKLGDVIVFKAPPDPEKSYIKRVIGVSGDSIMLQNGNVYLNGKILDESVYLKPTVRTYGSTFLKDGATITVPANSYFVMGDNREESSDSREWGFLTRGDCSFPLSDIAANCNIEGYSFFVYWPLNDMKFVKNPYGIRK